MNKNIPWQEYLLTKHAQIGTALDRPILKQVHAETDLLEAISRRVKIRRSIYCAAGLGPAAGASRAGANLRWACHMLSMSCAGERKKRTSLDIPITHRDRGEILISCQLPALDTDEPGAAGSSREKTA